MYQKTCVLLNRHIQAYILLLCYMNEAHWKIFYQDQALEIPVIGLFELRPICFILLMLCRYQRNINKLGLRIKFSASLVLKTFGWTPLSTREYSILLKPPSPSVNYYLKLCPLDINFYPLPKTLLHTTTPKSLYYVPLLKNSGMTLKGLFELFLNLGLAKTKEYQTTKTCCLTQF